MSDERKHAIFATSLAVSPSGADVPLINDLDVELLEGSCTIIGGENGVGKSLVLSVFATRVAPAAGELSILGRNLAQTPPTGLARLRRRIGHVEQMPRLLDHLSIFDNVALPLRIAGADASQIGGFVEELMDWIGLGPVGSIFPGELSFGHRKLVAMARAVIARPSLLLLDEPVQGLDGRNRERMITLISQFRRMGTTIVIASRDDAFNQRSQWPRLELCDGRLESSQEAA